MYLGCEAKVRKKEDVSLMVQGKRCEAVCQVGVERGTTPVLRLGVERGTTPELSLPVERGPERAIHELPILVSPARLMCPYSRRQPRLESPPPKKLSLPL
jgi:hypothetical protein